MVVYCGLQIGLSVSRVRALLKNKEARLLGNTMTVSEKLPPVLAYKSCATISRKVNISRVFCLLWELLVYADDFRRVYVP